jgi:hypothetical protein
MVRKTAEGVSCGRGPETGWTPRHFCEIWKMGCRVQRGAGRGLKDGRCVVTVGLFWSMQIIGSTQRAAHLSSM